MLRFHRLFVAAVLCLGVVGAAVAQDVAAPQKTADELAAEKAAAQAKVDAAAEKELRELLAVEKEPASRAEALILLKEMALKAEAFAEKHQADRGGAMALMIVAQISARQLGDSDMTIKAMNRFLKRYPKDPDVAFAKFFLGSALLEKGDMKGAKGALTALLKDHPNFRGKAQAAGLLKKIELREKPAPDFTTKDLEGNEVKLSSLRGKIVLLDFYAGWCDPCRVEMPNLKRLYAKYKDRGLVIVGISLDRSLDAAKKYVKDTGITWTATWQAPGGWKNPIVGLYGVNGIPAMFILGKDGKIMKTDVRGEALVRALAEIFPEKNPAEEKKREEKKPAE